MSKNLNKQNFLQFQYIPSDHEITLNHESIKSLLANFFRLTIFKSAKKEQRPHILLQLRIKSVAGLPGQKTITH